MKKHYAVAFDAAGRVAVWSGPYVIRSAQLKADEYEHLYPRARAMRWHAALTKETEDGLCECGNRKRHPGCEGCDECARIYGEFRESETRGLRDHVRTLLTKHYPDWLEGVAIRSEFNTETSTALSRLVEAGDIEARIVKGMGTMYRIKQRRAA